MKKKIVCLVGMTVISIIIIGLLLAREAPQPTFKEGWRVTVELITPRGSYIENTPNFASIMFSKRPDGDPQNILDEILGYPEGGQYVTWDLIENILENQMWAYKYSISGLSDNRLIERDIPPIRQDNENINFCFYVAHGAEPLSTSTWWSEIGCNYLRFKLILPENYDLRMDVRNPSGIGGKGWFKDNDYSIFTTASSLTKMLENNRWCIEAIWEPRNPSPIITADLYLEVHYRKIQP
jgi:hypothetical protein